MVTYHNEYLAWSASWNFQDSGFSVFPAQHLSKLYAEKRARMKQQLQQWRRNGWIDSEAEPSLLLIDDICDLFGRQFKVIFRYLAK